MDNKKTIPPECLFPGDPRVRMLLGRQKIPAASQENIRKSSFVFSFYTEEVCLLFHTLTRELLILPAQGMEYLADDRLFPHSVLKEELPKKLYEEHFLVPEHTREDQLYLELKDILVLKEELPIGSAENPCVPQTISIGSAED